MTRPHMTRRGSTTSETQKCCLGLGYQILFIIIIFVPIGVVQSNGLCNLLLVVGICKQEEQYYIWLLAIVSHLDNIQGVTERPDNYYEITFVLINIQFFFIF